MLFYTVFIFKIPNLFSQTNDHMHVIAASFWRTLSGFLLLSSVKNSVLVIQS